MNTVPIDQPSASTSPPGHQVGRGLSRKERVGVFLHRESDKRLSSLAVALYRLTKGGITKALKVDVLLLTTRGRKSGKERTVVLQYFPEGDDIVLTAANDGGSSHPGWYYNLKATPAATVEVMGRSLRVRGEEMSAESAAAFWPRIVSRDPNYERYARATSRTIPVVRLIVEGAKP